MLWHWDDAVQRHGSNEAICDDVRSFTYDDLDSATDAIAATLIRRGVAAEQLVGLDFVRPIDYAIGMLAALKAGGGFVIPEKGRPAAPMLWLCRGDLDQLRLSESDCAAIDIGRLEATSAIKLRWQDRLVSPRQLAYVLYTSGSTAHPKGVMIERANLTAFAIAVKARLGITAGDRWLQIAAPSFDVFIEEVFPTLLAGGTVLCRATVGPIELATVHRALSSAAATLVEMTTQYWYEYQRWLRSAMLPAPRALRMLVVGGERMDSGAYRRWQAHFETALVHVYGITEVTVSSTMFSDRLSEADREVPVGRALQHCDVSVRSGGAPLAPGEEGEIHIGGNAVGRGYVGNPALTAARFLPDPCGAPGSRVYASGDRGVMTAGGDLVCRGRSDDQVKLRGRRLELSEVEDGLRRIPSLNLAAVLVEPASRSNLVPFVVPPSDAAA